MLTISKTSGSENLGKEQKVKDAFAVALVVFFLIVAFAGLYMLDKGNTSTFAIVASVAGITGGIVALVVAVLLILGDEN
jgi:small neutral amino acid transporter SnatA (MarC family)